MRGHRAANLRRGRLIAASAGLGLLTAAGIASAQNGPGGLNAPAPPEARALTCLERCLDARTVAETGRIEITGRSLGAVSEVTFAAAEGRVTAPAAAASEQRLEARVPRGARTGRVVVHDPFGGRSAVPERLTVRPETAVADAGPFAVRSADASPRKVFFHGRRPARVTYQFEATSNTDVRIDVVRQRGGKAVRTIVERNQEPFATHSARWDGLRNNGKVAASGRYRFRISPLSGGDGGATGFRHFDHIFPVRANRIGWGDGVGAGRNHQGQDVFARCGAPIVAARGGRVVVSKFHSRAGYYLVIAGRKTGVEYAYMHLQRRGRPRQGARVRTGDVIGRNGKTGNASGCHLHFEMWSAPGWYKGGRVMNPTPHLRRWRGWS